MVPAAKVTRERWKLTLPTIDIARLPSEVEADGWGVAVIVDVLRATTTMASMLDAGAIGVLTVAEVTDAVSVARTNPNASLAGERGGIPPAGFDLGNSPLPRAVESVKGRHVVMTTTNGTKAIQRASGIADLIITLSLTNLPAVVLNLEQDSRDVLIICSGTDGQRSLEDELAAGLLADGLSSGWERSEAASQIRHESLDAIERHGSVQRALRQSPHAARLSELGFDDDVEYCGGIGQTTTIPTLDRSLGMFVAG
ncbi:MAG: 2-phosphosulfolactate phosphatase [Phycisphaerales bacterium]